MLQYIAAASCDDVEGRGSQIVIWMIDVGISCKRMQISGHGFIYLAGTAAAASAAAVQLGHLSRSQSPSGGPQTTNPTLGTTTPLCVSTVVVVPAHMGCVWLPGQGWMGHVYPYFRGIACIWLGGQHGYG